MWAEADRLNWSIKSQGHVEEVATEGTKAGLQRKVLGNDSLSSELRVVHFSTADITAIEGWTDTSVGDPRKQPKLKPYGPQTAASTSCQGDATLRSYSLIKKIDI